MSLKIGQIRGKVTAKHCLQPLALLCAAHLCMQCNAMYCRSIPSAGLVYMQAQCSVRDCKVGPGFKLSERSEYRDEILAKGKVL